MKRESGFVASHKYPARTEHVMRVSPDERLTITCHESGAATFGMWVIQREVTSVWGDIPLQHVVMLLEAAGYRVETPKEASATKALLLEAAEIIDSEFGTRKGTHPIVAQLRKAAER